MNFYETLFIIHPALESGHLKDILHSIDDNLKNLGCKMLSIEVWGKKRLAYLIDKQKYGTYVQLQFSGNGSCTRDFEIELQHNANVLSYLTTSISKAEVVEQEHDIETQIAGHSRESDVSKKTDENKIAESENQESKNDSKQKTITTDELPNTEVTTSEKDEKTSEEETNINVEKNNSTESNEE